MILTEGVTKRLVLVRHGEPSASAKGRCYGKLDVGLSERGRKQIETACEFLNSLKFSTIYASPRERAGESGKIIARKSEVVIDICEDCGETIAIVSHGGVNRIILAHFLKMQNADIFRLGQDYACVNIIDFFEDFPLVKILNYSGESFSN